MGRTCLDVAGEWRLTPERVAVHRPTATAVVADLHLGYDQARQRRGEAVPGRSLENCLTALGAVVFHEEVRRLVIAGDLFEEGRSGASNVAPLRKWLEDNAVELAGLVPGNHDRGLNDALQPVCNDGARIGRWLIVHGDGKLPPGPLVHGHFHPSLRLPGQAATPCFLVGTDRLVLPAFSADAAGGNVLKSRRWKSFRCCAIAGDQVLDFGPLGDLGARMSRHAARLSH
ncbi:MAG: metallophosphoesterase [Gemmataceae bacterium]|nr:metallophosphoesterase [Gemmataceae bacterium]